MPADLVPVEMLDRAARRFKVLSETALLQILNLLHQRGELNVQDIVEATGLQQANVSKHLRTLTDEGMLSRRKEGLFVYYDIVDPSLSGLCLLVCSQLRRVAPSDEPPGA